MKQLLTFWKYQAILFARNKLLVTGLLFLFASAIFSARYGQHFVAQQETMIYSIDTLEQRNREYAINEIKRRDTARMNAEDSIRFNKAGKYYQSGIAESKTLVYRPGPFTSLAIGQKDNFPFYHSLAGYDANIYTAAPTDIQNPVKLLAGNFDLSFVIIYLLPLFIIAIGYNVLSGEKETHTFTLLRVQGSAKRVLSDKLMFQAALLIICTIIMCGCAFIVNGITRTATITQMISWMLIAAIYILFWCSIVYFVASLQRSSATNALVLGGTWILLLLLVPSVIHKSVSSAHEQELAQTMFNSRGDLPTARDLDSAQLIDSFNRLKHDYPIPAMNDTGSSAQRFYENLMRREIQTRFDNELGKAVIRSQVNEYNRAMSLNWVNPVFAIQNAFNQLGNSEINNYHHYLAEAETYQTKRRYHLNNYAIQGKAFGMDDYLNVPEFKLTHSGPAPMDLLRLLAPVMLLSLVLVLLAAFRPIR
ncbi:ABC transporter permease subunit [Chitinophaga horti]|uniref:ABC transporter permease subunit n=1 Tax=Chitinophaga horti TaxID=2920382 RepID=A0ABY6IUT3_9BACT|nr:ABC transporter permease subunit [Chitinophaga horti]UYQ90973.1 ABC transporter permease subunit [Chitinophaga horti]